MENGTFALQNLIFQRRPKVLKWSKGLRVKSRHCVKDYVKVITTQHYSYQEIEPPKDQIKNSLISITLYNIKVKNKENLISKFKNERSYQ